ncbi:MAG: hypothetical protein ACPGTS_02070, partial [Minisyncoccia bacterium]
MIKYQYYNVSADNSQLVTMATCKYCEKNTDGTYHIVFWNCFSDSWEEKTNVDKSLIRSEFIFPE